MIFRQRSKTAVKQDHSFDHYPVSQWLDAFRKFDYQDIHLKISGGEPFMDRKNLRDLLAGLSKMKHILVGVDTNGFWDPAYFSGIDKSRIFLNVAFHPEQTRFEDFFPRLLAIRDAGFHVPMINYVLAPENQAAFEEARTKMEKEKFFVNVSILFETGIYLSRSAREERELEIIEKYCTPLEGYFKVVRPVTKDRPCFYPAMTYYLMYDGRIQLACMNDTWQNLFTEGPPPLPRAAVPCPLHQCIGCADMYRALADEPRFKAPLKLYTQIDYADEVHEFRQKQKRNNLLKKVPLGKLFADPDPPSLRPQIPPREVPNLEQLIPVDAIRMPLPDSPVFGRLDHPVIEARSRDRISLSGWAASRTHAAPLQEVHIQVGGKDIGVVREFFHRPDVAISYGRPDLAKCGWRTMLFLPALPLGEHALVAKGVDHDGSCAELATSRINIID
jgi:organic radical activating enzyme